MERGQRTVKIHTAAYYLITTNRLKRLGYILDNIDTALDTEHTAIRSNICHFIKGKQKNREIL